MTASTNFSENNAIQQHKQLNQLRKRWIPCNSTTQATKPTKEEMYSLQFNNTSN